jgi:pimeloyl-ACP methyl ester carboxylesterase
MPIIPIRDISLFVQVIGQGTPLVLMHGGPGQDYTTLLPLEPLADQFTLIFYDHRCNGQSEAAPLSSMTWENLCADADALREELGFDRWAVLGHSFGGNVALEYALRYPQNLSCLLLMDTGGDHWWVQQNAPDVLAKRGYSPSAVHAARRFYNGQLTADQYFPTVLKFFKAYYYRMNLLGLFRDIVSGPRAKFRPEATIFGYSQLLDGWTVMDRLENIKVPTLVLAGRHDFLFPPEHQAILADRIPDSKLVLLECAGHNLQIERPAEVIHAISDFMTATAPVNTR